MTDYGYIFSKALHEKLEEKIRAKVDVRSTDNDVLKITITRETESEQLIFQTEIRDFANKIVHGYSTEYAAYEVLTKYRRVILNKYFYERG